MSAKNGRFCRRTHRSAARMRRTKCRAFCSRKALVSVSACVLSACICVLMSLYLCSVLCLIGTSTLGRHSIQKRWFVLRGSHLSYWVSQAQEMAGEPPIKLSRIELRGRSVRVVDAAKFHFEISAAPQRPPTVVSVVDAFFGLDSKDEAQLTREEAERQRVYELFASDEAAMKQWIRALQDACELPPDAAAN
jgi:hypothetical protein